MPAWHDPGPLTEGENFLLNENIVFDGRISVRLAVLQ
jgi:hypothetical protein